MCTNSPPTGSGTAGPPPFCRLNVQIIRGVASNTVGSSSPGDGVKVGRDKRLVLVGLNVLHVFPFVAMCVYVCPSVYLPLRIDLVADSAKNIVVALSLLTSHPLSSQLLREVLPATEHLQRR